MRRFPVVPVALALLIGATVALAAKDKVVASFEPLAASGVSGDVSLQVMPKGGTLVHGNLRGLQANTEYVSLSYANGTCTSGSDAIEITRFQANAAGNAAFTKQIDRNLTQIKSVSIVLASDQSAQACAAVTQ